MLTTSSPPRVVGWRAAGFARRLATIPRRMKPDYRLFLCARCRRQVALCSDCDRGHRYCSAACSRTRRRESVRAAGRRYQATPEGRRRHAIRQARYRLRQATARLGPQGVTHHTPSEPGRSRELLPSRFPSAPVASRRVDCSLCGAPCRPYARLGPKQRARRRMAPHS
jgi:hypothetical protein